MLCFSLANTYLKMADKGRNMWESCCLIYTFVYKCCVLEYIYRRLSPRPPHVASPVWHFSDPRHLTASFSHLLHGVDNVQK